eukprot:1139197-Pelagomonas_calceolata.AAC.5
MRPSRPLLAALMKKGSILLEPQVGKQYVPVLGCACQGRVQLEKELAASVKKQQEENPGSLQVRVR